MEEQEKPKKKRGPAPVIIPREVSAWIHRTSTNEKVNDYKKGGGLPSWNGSK